MSIRSHFLGAPGRGFVGIVVGALAAGTVAVALDAAPASAAPIGPRTNVINEFAGTGVDGSSGDGGPARNATLGNAQGLVSDSHGNVFIADSRFNVVRRVDARSGVITTYAGVSGTASESGDGGPATAAHLNGPVALAVDATDNLYVADYFGQTVRRIDGRTSVITTVATSLPLMLALAVDGMGHLYISTNRSVVVRDPASGAISPVPLPVPPGRFLDPPITTDAANNLYFVTHGVGNNQVIERYVPSTSSTTVVAGDVASTNTRSSGDGGRAIDASIHPQLLAIDKPSNVLYFEESTIWSDNSIRAVDLGSGLIASLTDIAPSPPVVSGAGGPSAEAKLYAASMAVDPRGRIYLGTVALDASPVGSRVDVVTCAARAGHGVCAPAQPTISSVPTGPGPAGVAIDVKNHSAYIANSGNGTVSVVDTQTKTITTSISVGGDPTAVAVDQGADRVYVTLPAAGVIKAIDTTTNTVSNTIAVGVLPNSVTIDSKRHRAFVTNSGSNSVSVIDIKTALVTDTVAVAGATGGIAVDSALHKLYVLNSDGHNDVIVFDVGGAHPVPVSTVALAFGDLVLPNAIAINGVTHTAYVAFANSPTIRPIDLTVDAVRPFLGSIPGQTAISVDPAINRLYVEGAGRLAGIDTASGVLTDITSHSGGGSGLAVASNNKHEVWTDNVVAGEVAVFAQGS